MAVNVETLDKLERKITLELPVEAIQKEVNARLKRLQRQVKMDGFRPGKVPLSVVAQRYGYSVHYEVMNDEVGRAFNAAVAEAQLRVAGQPRITEKEGAPEGVVAFEAVFEVFPDVKLGDLSAVSLEKLEAEVDEAAIERTLEILRKQRRTFSPRPEGEVAQNGDRVTIDFEGKIDGEPFEGGQATDFVFVLGDGQMLKEFEDAVLGMKVGESKTFPLAFPADYHGKEVAGKTADFLVTVKKIEQQHLPEVDEAFVKSLGIEAGTIEALREDIRRNLEREVKFRLQARNKVAALDALAAAAELDLPKAAVEAEIDRLIEGARNDLKQRGVKDADKAPIPRELFQQQAERRVRLGLVVAELIKAHDLRATPEQIDAHLRELASSYEYPEEVVRWYKSNPERLSEIEAIVLENNVADFIFGQAQVTPKRIGFAELMGQG
ncbi:trigger factor [Tepidimonas taiwanensis]|mgnify:CR=1 FL=1|uniref:Trigger factor n=1 Tax=Tepidimonas taiwanensis TaxID=307486 RepID=A0A554X1P2_9BURK|nr:trigger factor [Tepidimonas taiwanensis]MCX7693657.1 trigger factor [Tepidimonas taiwanensis]MDM7462045.1 trigger factor [Tepidimonas taiwanensis]TSE29759.1 Trigger factor [Tepidimonas taiwanensis]UBQ04302.1 trigger factor [Tepidimonas taiwanensis]